MIRRVVFIVVGLVVVLAAAFLIIPFVQARSLGAQLATDVAAIRQTKWPRNPPVPNPRHDNGFQCFVAMLKVMPRDVSPFDGKGDTAAPNPGAWVRAEDPEPVKTMPPELDARAQELSKWFDELRDCGNSRHLQYVDALTPWALPPRYGEAVMALSRFTSLEVRKLVANGLAEEAFNRCSSTLAFTLDQSHQGLLGAMVASASLRMLAPRCIEAWGALPAPLRPLTSAGWVTLATRFASAKEIFATERVCSSIYLFEPLAPHQGVPHVDELLLSDTTVISRWLVLRSWSSWDARMRALSQAAESPKERAQQAAALDALGQSWMSPANFAGAANYEKFGERVDQTRTVLTTLQWISGGAKGEPPPGMTRVDGAVEYKDADGKVHRIAVPPLE